MFSTLIPAAFTVNIAGIFSTVFTLRNQKKIGSEEEEEEEEEEERTRKAGYEEQ